jgi:hypothetical protein
MNHRMKINECAPEQAFFYYASHTTPKIVYGDGDAESRWQLVGLFFRISMVKSNVNNKAENLLF